MLSEEQKADGWIEHDGGACPVPRWEVMLRKGEVLVTAHPYQMAWDQLGEQYQSDIVAYRPEPRP
ncbi:MAG: hypothetical protein ACRCYS_16550 [Beijerinckiaceae bacterium]